MKRIKLQIAFVLLLFLLSSLLFSCAGTRNIREGEALLSTVTIKNNKTRLTEDELMAYVYQKPNRKFLYTTKVFLDIYNIINTKKAEQRYAQKKAKLQLKNLRKIDSGKDTTSRTPVGLRFVFMKIGEPPVIYTQDKTTRDGDKIPFGKPTLHDSINIEKSRKQLEIVLNENGYFNSTVSDTIIYNKKNNKAKLIFKINQQPLHKFQNITYNIEDAKMTLLIIKNHQYSKIKKGDPFSRVKIDDERNRIADLMRNNGYYHFSKQYINFWMDTIGKKNNFLDLTIEILKPQTVDNIANEMAFKTSLISNVKIVLQQGNTIATDSLAYKQNYSFFFNNKIPFNPSTIDEHIVIRPNEFYDEQKFNNSYSYLTRLKIFRARISTEEIIDSVSLESKLNAIITLKPLYKQTYSLDIQGSNTGGNFGIPVQTSYINRSLFRGIEAFKITLTTALENQAIVVPITSKIPIFNTFRIIPAFALSFPKFLAPFKPNWIKNHDFTSTINLLFAYENRLEHYVKKSVEFNFNYKGYLSDKWFVTFSPIEISYLNNKLSPQFLDTLNANFNFAQKRRFISKMIPDSKIGFNFNNSYGKFKQHSYGVSINLETAGFMLRKFKEWTNAPISGSVSDPYYVASNVRFSQYWRTEFEVKTYYKIKTAQTFAFRSIFGIAKPYGNEFVLPFEKAFFSGGANSVRAWRAYRLGIGSEAENNNLDMTGDVKFEFNFESRTKLYGFLESALFMDVGNIWLYKNDKNPKSGFAGKSVNTLFKELGVGAGIGFRLNFSFFIIRIDPAIKIYNPGYYNAVTEVQEPWFYTKPFQFRDINWNVAIGYPF